MRKSGPGQTRLRGRFSGGPLAPLVGADHYGPCGDCYEEAAHPGRLRDEAAVQEVEPNVGAVLC